MVVCAADQANPDRAVSFSRKPLSGISDQIPYTPLTWQGAIVMQRAVFIN